MDDNEILINKTGTITESLTTGDCVRPGCLGKLRGPIADWNDSTRNKRFYSRELWVKVFDTPWVQEAIQTHTLFGEADHPEERIEPLLTQAAVVLTDYVFDDTNKVVFGSFDILDTPSGRILRTLAEYGCELGVSSRGRGQLVTRNGRQEVDPDSYMFGGFDVVALPAVKKARQKFILESTSTKDFRLDIVEQIEMCESESDLRIIKNVLDAANLSDRTKIDHLIESRISELNTSEDDTIIDGLTRDLREACDQIKDLKDKLSEANTIEITDTINDEGRISELEDQLKERDRQIEELRSCLLAENSDQFNEEIEAKLNENHEMITSMSEELADRDQEVEKLSSIINGLRESLDENQQKLAESESRFEESREKVISLDSELNSMLQEYNEVVDDYNKLLMKNNELIERYLNEQAIKLSISRNDLVKLLPEGYDISDIDDTVEKQLKLRQKITKLPVFSGASSMNNSLNESAFTHIPHPSDDSPMDNTRKLLKAMKKDRES